MLASRMSAFHAAILFNDIGPSSYGFPKKFLKIVLSETLHLGLQKKLTTLSFR